MEPTAQGAEAVPLPCRARIAKVCSEGTGWWCVPVMAAAETRSVEITAIAARTGGLQKGQKRPTSS